MTNPLATLRTQVAKDLAPLFPTIAIEKVQEALERGKEQSTEEITFCLILPRITKDVKGISAGVEEKVCEESNYKRQIYAKAIAIIE